ncbi:hypothetical protein GIB67_022036, partial [Kingdonia uniflora]
MHQGGMVVSRRHIPRNKTCPSIKETEENQKGVSEEPPKDYVHVRARRGEATDSHSLTERESSDERRDYSDASGGLTCHQCRRNDTGRVYWCLKCDRRGYCDSCISKWYADIPLQEVQRIFPLCRGTCN